MKILQTLRNILAPCLALLSFLAHVSSDQPSPPSVSPVPVHDAVGSKNKGEESLRVPFDAPSAESERIAEAVRLLHSADRLNAERARKTLKNSDRQHTMAELTKMLRNPKTDPWMKVSLPAAIALLKKDGHKLFEDSLRDPPFENVFEWALFFTAFEDDPPLEAMKHVLHDPDAAARSVCLTLKVAGWLGYRVKWLIPDVAPLVEHENPSIHEAAAKTLEILKFASPPQPLHNCLPERFGKDTTPDLIL